MELSSANLAQITELGNIAVAGPAAAAVALWLWWFWDNAIALVYATNALLVILATVLLKLVSARTGISFAGTPWMLSDAAPSGHMAAAMISYGAAAALVLGGATGLMRLGGVLVLAGLVALVGYTRVALHAHTVADVLAAVLVGLPLLPILAVLGHRRKLGPDAAFGLCATVIAVALLLQLSGVHLDSVQLL